MEEAFSEHEEDMENGATLAEEIVPVVDFGEPTLMETGLYKEARDKFLSKMFYVQETRPNTDSSSCKDSSTLKKKTNSEKVKTKKSNKDKSIIIAKNIFLPKTKGGKEVLETRNRRRQELEEGGHEKEAALMMIVSTTPNKESKSTKRKRELKEGSPSTEAVSEANLKETAPMVLARLKSAAYK